MFLHLQWRKGITMFDSFRSWKPGGRSEARSKKSRQGRPLHHRRLVCEALEARTLLSAAPAAFAGGLQAAAAAQQRSLFDLPIAAQHAVSSAIGQDQSAYHAASSAAGVSFANPANGFTAQVQSGALRVSAGSDTWDMALVGLGYGGPAGTMYSWSTVGTAKTTADGNRVDLNYGTVDEWYVNGPDGLEQGFNVTPPAQPGAGGSLTVELALGGNLKGTVNAAGSGLSFSGPDGSAALGYTGLTAYDATGKSLPASLQVWTSGGHQELLIHVDDAGAQGQITIDPFLQQAKLTDSNGAAYDAFGSSVAISGNTLVVGEAGAEDSGSNQQGAAYVFTNSGSAWTQAAALTASDGTAYGSFGFAVSISGNTVAVGAPYATIDGNENVGAVYVFTEPASGWANMTQTAKLTPSDASANLDDELGYSVSISGNTLLAGAGWPDYGASAAYEFTEPASGWANMTQTAKFSTSKGGEGYTVSISGNTAVVGSPLTAGAYVFTEPASGWANMTPSVTLSVPNGGTSVSISGNTLVVGADEAMVGANSQQGEAYVFTKSGSAWSQTATLTASDGAAGDFFGSSVSISGSTVAVTAPYATVGANGQQGAAYVFTNSGSAWSQTAKLTASDGEAGDLFGGIFYGNKVSISGNTVVVGAPYAWIGDTAQQGAAYVFGPSVLWVTGVSSPDANETYGLGATIPITLTFNEAVTVTGTPQLALNDGGVASYVSGSGSSTLTFDYTVASGQNTHDLDYASTAALTLNGGSILDAEGNAAALALPSTGSDGLATQAIVIYTSPVVTSVSPASGPLAGGTSVTIAGSGFNGATAVDFGSIAATNVAVNAAGTQITAVSPAGTGTVDVTVVGPGGTSATSSADQFSYVAPPTVTGLSSTLGPAAGGTSVTITGTGFTGATAVDFGSTAATNVVVNTAGTQVTAISPAGTGTVNVTVVTPGGTSPTSPADQFSYVAPPTVTGLSPSKGPSAGGTSVTITGTGFTGVTAVDFGSTAATNVVVNAAGTQITVISPAGTGTVNVTVVGPGGTSATSSADQFSYVAPPKVTGLSPTSGPAAGGTSVTITGTGFTGATAVDFGSTAATNMAVNAAGTKITAISPAGTGTVNVTVVTPGGTSAISSADQFSYKAVK